MEVAGASLATIIGQTVAFIIAIWVIIRGRSDLKLKLKEGFKPDYVLLGNISKIGIPSMLENIVMRTGIIIYAITVARLGTDAYATHQVCMSLQALSFMNGQAFAVSATTLMGQSLGKNRPDMAQTYCSRTQKLGMYVSIILMCAFVFFGKEIIMLYNTDSYMVETGAKILFLLAFTQPFQASQFILSGALRGAGDTKATARITTVTVLFLRPALAILLINGLKTGLIGAWIALAADQLARTLLVVIRYRSGKWKTAYVEKKAA
jgi:putative MATE family efflux protein